MASSTGAPIPTSANFMDTVLNTYALKPDVLESTILSHPREGTTLEQFMMLCGRTSPKKRTTWIYGSRGKFQPAFGVNANVVAPALGANQVWVIPAADHFVADDTKVPVRVGQIIEFPNGVQGEVLTLANTAPGATTITIRGQAGVQYPAVNVGDRIIITSNAQPEFNTTLDSVAGDITTRSHRPQTIIESYKISGRAWTAGYSWSRDSNGTYYWYITDMNETRKRFKRQKEMALLKQDPTMTFADASTTVMTGLIPFMESEGIEVNHVPGALVLSDFDSAIDLIDAELVNTTDYDMLCGSHYLRDAETMIRTMFPNGAIDYGDSETLSRIRLKLKFKGLTYRGYNFNFGKLDEFHNPDGLGAPGKTWIDSCLMIPNGKVVNSIDGKSVPQLELCYMADNGVSRANVYSMTGGGGPKSGDSATSTLDGADCKWLYDGGLYPKEGSNFVLMRP